MNIYLRKSIFYVFLCLFVVKKYVAYRQDQTPVWTTPIWTIKDIPSYQQVFFKGSTETRYLETWFGL